MSKDSWCYYSDLPSPSAYVIDDKRRTRKKVYLLRKLLRIIKKKGLL